MFELSAAAISRTEMRGTSEVSDGSDDSERSSWASRSRATMPQSMTAALPPDLMFSDESNCGVRLLSLSSVGGAPSDGTGRGGGHVLKLLLDLPSEGLDWL